MFKIVGIEHINYVSKKTGQPVDAYRFFLLDEEFHNNVIGDRIEVCFISGKYMNDILSVCGTSTVADLIHLKVNDIFYNRYGNVTGFSFN